MNSATTAHALSVASTSTPPTTPTPEQLLATLRDVLDRIKISQQYADDLKAQLAELREAGAIPDSLEHHGVKATWTERKGAWAYSSAVDNLKTLEEAEGVATRKPSSFFWTIKTVAS